ncbi:phosphate ABC transporter substrate-binding protein [Aquisalimonas lutea]|uniref:phosphate ABC transporter substrate-binding protein n=1 Tax=Aquisalimonas lutea TaxID=1327750 RepID=UPI0025B5B993|nr:phosphate ABC transporter substrate-binding protein [Aquisalimonas lutea]MDN3519416.1 phosphate ABC transporter substrate-binding protein [Aquisalimonas lutea]
MTGLPKQLLTTLCGLVCSLMIGTAAAEIVVVVSRDNPVDSLSRTELADIYLGRMDRFPNGDPAMPIDQAERSPAHDAFYNDYLGRSPAQIKAHWSRLIFTGRGQPPRSLKDGDTVAEFIADNPRAIGYVDRSMVGEQLRVVTIE